MKKTIARLTMAIAIMLVMTIMLLALATVNASALTKTIKQGVKTSVNLGPNASNSTVAYYKIKPTKKGVIQFTVNANYSGNVMLCNAKKKVISKYDSGW